MKDLLLAEEMKTIICNMAIDCTLPSDMTQLDMFDILSQARENLQNSEDYIRTEQIEELGNYISDDCIEAYDKLIQAEEDGKGNEMADNFITMWEPLEYRYTVSQLLEQL